jgi:ferredoxin
MNTAEQITRRVILAYPKFISGQPIITGLVREYDLEVNIYRASVTPNEEGYIALDITGDEEQIQDGLEFIKSFQIDVNLTMNSMLWDENKCAGCGNCVPHCPTNALHVIDDRSRKIDFSRDRCIECLKCIQNCPFGACSTIF